MFPLRDNIPSLKAATLNYLLILINVLVFLLELSMGRELNEFIRVFGFVPHYFFLHLGHGKYLILYLASGAAACFAQLLSGPSSMMPMVGASGAIAGVMGAYFCLFPNARILTLIPLLFFVIVEIPAYIFLGFWFLLQFFAGTFSILGARADVGVAFWAHVGGFIFGYLFLHILAPGRAKSPFQTQS